jgi:hypothetical protein
MWQLLAGPILSIINKVIEDKAQAAAVAGAIQQAAATGAIQEEMQQLTAITTAQSDINKIEAGSTSLFVAGWRPGIGWVCAVAFAFQFLVKPTVEWVATIAGHPITLPGIDANLPQLTYALLGMGTLRTVEKFKGVAGNH